MGFTVGRFFIGAWLLLAAAGTAAQLSPQDYRDSLEQRNRWTYLTRDLPFPAQWIKKTGDFVYMKSVEGGFAFVRETADTGARRPAFDQQRLAASLGKAMGESFAPLRLPFAEFDYEEGAQAITFILEDVLWRCTLTDYQCGRGSFAGRPQGFDVVRDLRFPAENYPHRSPDGKWEALVLDDNVVVRPTGGGEPILLSMDGSRGDFYDPESIRWSPDSTRLVAYRVRPGYARYVTRVISSPSYQLQPDVAVQLYPKPGDAIDIERPVLFDIAKRSVSSVAEELIPNAYLLRNLEWRKDGRSFAFEYTRRGHQQAKLIEVDAQSGAARAVIAENTDSFIDLYNGFRHDVNGGAKEVVWLSERDGWRHLYLYDGKSGKVKNRITKGAWPVRSVLKVDDAKRQIWFAASGMNEGEDPYYVHYYRVDFEGRNLTPVTTASATHHLALSSDFRYFVDTYSRVDLPPVSELRRASDGALIRVIEKADIAPLLADGYRAPESFVAKGRDGETDIWGLIYRPRDFNPSRKYRVIEEIYAGPQGSFVQKGFWGFGSPGRAGKAANMQALADLGFIVVQMDGMGTANRSKPFHNVAWKNLRDAGFPDRILWHRAAAAQFPWYDIAGGIGIYGGSAGGQNALGALLFHPDVYSAAVASAGSYDNRMDKIWWNEQWMGWPVDESYVRSSGVANAGRLQGKLMLIFGEQDDNVDPSTSLQVVNALIKAGKDFDLLQIPGGRHSVGRAPGLADYVERRKYDFFVRNLLGHDTPQWNKLRDAGERLPLP